MAMRKICPDARQGLAVERIADPARAVYRGMFRGVDEAREDGFGRGLGGDAALIDSLATATTSCLVDWNRMRVRRSWTFKTNVRRAEKPVTD
jgi:hypothetical protein